MTRIGISGWRYAPWRGRFYPRGLAQRDELAFASRMFSTIEINGSFYSLQRPESYRAWREQTPEGFVFAVKGPRYITHMLRLKEVGAPLANFFASGVLALGPKLGPVLWQLPPGMSYDPERLDSFLALLPRDAGSVLALARARDEHLKARAFLKAPDGLRIRHALEVRHASFFVPGFFEILRKHGVALVISDAAGKWPSSENLTADFVYVRLHGDKEIYASGYGDAALDRWSARIDAWRNGHRDVFCYFDNDTKVRAPYDAANLARRLGEPSGMAPTGEFVVPPGVSLKGRRGTRRGAHVSRRTADAHA